MARYIDADKFIERIKVSPAFRNMGWEGEFLRNVVIDLLNNVPTADVAPKSEVATSVINDLLDLLHSSIGDIKMSPDTTYQIVYLYAKEIEKKYTEEKKQ